MSFANARVLMVTYSAGFIALFGTFMLLHLNALRQRQALRLDTMASFDAKASVRRHGISVGFGLASVAIVMFGPAQALPAAGLIYCLMGPAHGAFGVYNARARARLEARSCPPSGMPEHGATSAIASTD